MDFKRLNSLTKYPSIPTYHALGDKGALTDERVPFPDDADVYVTEKIDGTNARIIFLADDNDFLIGSREELLHACGDRIIHPTLGIVPTLLDLAYANRHFACDAGVAVAVWYGEVYGGRVTAASKQYTADPAWTSFRLFDVQLIEDPKALMAKTPEDLALWRESGAQHWLDDAEIDNVVERHYRVAERLRRVPCLTTLPGGALPRSHADTLSWLRGVAPQTRAMLAMDDANTIGKAEGVVIRTVDRRHIAKVRFEDYERAERRAGKAVRR